LLHRSLGAPLAAGPLGDHRRRQRLRCTCSREDGALLNRLTHRRLRHRRAPVLAGNTVVVVTRNGGVFGYRPE
jgi:outer membrane protein assembly factor BamB